MGVNYLKCPPDGPSFWTGSPLISNRKLISWHYSKPRECISPFLEARPTKFCLQKLFGNYQNGPLNAKWPRAKIRLNPRHQSHRSLIPSLRSSGLTATGCEEFPPRLWKDQPPCRISILRTTWSVRKWGSVMMMWMKKDDAVAKYR